MDGIQVLNAARLASTIKVPARKTKNVQWQGLEFTVKTQITLQEYMNLVKKIIADIKHDEDIAYELVDFAFRTNVIASYAFIELPKDITALCEITYNTDLYETVAREIQQWQLKNLEEVIYAYTGIHGGAYESI